MGWLRIDDRFTANTKIVQLTDAEFRVWMRVLCHCASSHDPSVDAVARREISGLSKKRVMRFHELGLLDEIGDEYEVHDWSVYLPKDATNRERQARFRARQRYATNGKSVTDTVTETVTETVTSSRARDAGAGTRGVPSRPVPKEPSVLPSVPSNADDGRTDGELERLDPHKELPAWTT